ncbi:Plant UBX domain-containing protein 1, partial [Haplosporangium sp. Z 27]
PTHVDLALQLENGERKIQSFAITTTLWDVLLGFEKASNGTLNLTRRTGVPQTTTKNIFSLQRIKKAKPSAEVYMLPVVILLDREYVSIPTLKTTTLQLAGLLKGNSVFRVIMRYTDAGIADFIEDIERDFSPPIKTTTIESTPLSSSTTSESSDTITSSVSTFTPVTELITITPPTSTSSQQDSSPHHTSPSRHNTMPLHSSPSRSHTVPVHPSPSRHESTAHIVRVPTRSATINKTMGEVDSFASKEALHHNDYNISPQGIETPDITARSGAVDTDTREGNMVAPTPGTSINIELQRPSPVQEFSADMLDNSQEIRQLQEQRIQAAMTDRVKKLSKASDDSDRERFVRSLPPSAQGELTEEPDSMMDIDSQQEIVRQIAHRVSIYLKNAQQRGDSTVDYQTLIAQEIEKEQRAGVLPSTPSGSRHNSYYKSKAEDEASPMLVSPPSRSSTMPPRLPTPAAEEKIDRDVKVYRAPTDSSVPLSNQIELPDDFYELSSQDVMKLMNSQKARREQEENRGFKTAAVRAEEEKAKERRYPKTIIRIRFPNRVQIQATFRSQETIGDLREWVESVCAGHGGKFDLYTTPPKKVLTDNKQTLYQAGLAPQSIVYFSWLDSKLNLDSPFLNDEHLKLLQDLPIPGQEETESKPEEEPLSATLPMRATTDARTGSIPMLTREDRRMSARMSTDKPGSSSVTLPKWMKLSKK